MKGIVQRELAPFASEASAMVAMFGATLKRRSPKAGGGITALGTFWRVFPPEDIDVGVPPLVKRENALDAEKVKKDLSGRSI